MQGDLGSVAERLIHQVGWSVEMQELVADRFPITVSCTIHPWMRAWIRVFDHPYYAVTDDNGHFEIKDAPAGEYRLVV